jgi:sarcosine oxidase
MRVAIVGAGTFGASLAWWLVRRGEDVVLVDQFEPGDERATSGGETRLIRCSHGDDRDYAVMARRARELWSEVERDAGEHVLLRCGVSWFAHGDDGWEAASLRVLEELGVPAVRESVAEAARRFPGLRGDDLAWVLHEPEAGVLRATRAVRALVSVAVARGAELVQARARPDGRRVVLDSGRVLEADRVVWACGGWLAGLFPELITLRVTQQELYFLDGGPEWRGVGGWVDYDRATYGTGDLDGLGVKAAWDVEGPAVDPDAPLPAPTAEVERLARGYLADRFGDLARAPLVGSKTCRYELTPDSHFLAGPHPEHPEVWIVGGGSGHGFKHGPAMAERVIGAWDSGGPLPARFALGERATGRSLRTAGTR